MTFLREYALASGGTVVVELVGDDHEPLTVRGWRDQAGDLTERVEETFEDAVGHVRPAAEALLSSLGGMTPAPAEVTVEFTVKMSAQAGAVIATLGSEANFRVSLTWRDPGPSDRTNLS